MAIDRETEVQEERDLPAIMGGLGKIQICLPK